MEVGIGDVRSAFTQTDTSMMENKRPGKIYARLPSACTITGQQKNSRTSTKRSLSTNGTTSLVQYNYQTKMEYDHQTSDNDLSIILLNLQRIKFYDRMKHQDLRHLVHGVDDAEIQR
eukprot:667905-Amphidinium_carterae.1